jgi:DNA replication protein DnaC
MTAMKVRMTMDDDLKKTLRYLHLPGLLSHWDDYAELAQRKRWSPIHLLRHAVDEEAKIRADNAHKLRLTRARIPELWRMETFPFERQPKLDKKRVLSLYDAGSYMTQPHNVIWLGPTGCGKTGLATAFLIHAIERGRTGRYVLFADLITELYRSAADHSEQQVLQRYLAVDCLLVDEVGYVEVEPAQVGLFFTLMQHRHRKKPSLITSNLGFSEWRSFLKNDHLAAALIDRLTENSHIINMTKCVSLRPKLDPQS